MPANREDVAKILEDPEIPEDEKMVVMWQFNRGMGGTLLGSFQTALWEAIKVADDNNLELLARGFPKQVKGYLKWTRTDLAERLRAKGLGI